MKAMVYDMGQSSGVLEDDVYNGVRFLIVSLGTHPVAYVEDIIGVEGYGDKKLENIQVHGGFTYYGPIAWANNDKPYLGWDYSHAGDYTGYEELYPIPGNTSGKKWSSEEILDDVTSVIEQLLHIKRHLESADNDRSFEILNITIKNEQGKELRHFTTNCLIMGFLDQETLTRDYVAYMNTHKYDACALIMAFDKYLKKLIESDTEIRNLYTVLDLMQLRKGGK